MTVWLRPATFAEIKTACLTWHYARRIPTCRLGAFAVEEQERFIGVITFGAGNIRIHRPFNVNRGEAAELTRVALDRHQTPVSRIVSVACRLFRRLRPEIKVLVSYADQAQGHHGGIYQAAGWTYMGEVKTPSWIQLSTGLYHSRSIGSLYDTHAIPWLREHVDPTAYRVPMPNKHKYALALDPAILVAGLPYPRKRAG